MEKVSGDLSKHFAHLTYETNEFILKKSVLESKPNINISNSAVENAILYTKNIKCNKL
jgi:hypothetical protein